MLTTNIYLAMKMVKLAKLAEKRACVHVSVISNVDQPILSGGLFWLDRRAFRPHSFLVEKREIFQSVALSPMTSIESDLKRAFQQPLFRINKA